MSPVLPGPPTPSSRRSRRRVAAFGTTRPPGGTSTPGRPVPTGPTAAGGSPSSLRTGPAARQRSGSRVSSCAARLTESPPPCRQSVITVVTRVRTPHRGCRWDCWDRLAPRRAKLLEVDRVGGILEWGGRRGRSASGSPAYRQAARDLRPTPQLCRLGGRCRDSPKPAQAPPRTLGRGYYRAVRAARAIGLVGEGRRSTSRVRRGGARGDGPAAETGGSLTFPDIHPDRLREQ